ncbi:hypothetical protein TPCV2_08830 [Cutibacterium avidum]|uniref:Uncharacterized protein n=2 Tax=Cutibacterium avidum TaxID=33010 RepID=A0A3E2DN55_9ACTN|nr:hypothetical protein CHT91_00410 [Cutibacterium avidum]TMT55985.1 hypothetical protein DMY01_00420 [Cutibacterium avidum]BCQ01714.1 hypothetical protein TPCV4_01580 [Cutibacterium avidum]
MRMSKLEINPEEIDRGPLIAIAVAAVAVVGIALVAVRKGPKDTKTGSHDPSLFENLSKRKPAGGRKARRRDPRADGHATPMGGTGRVSTAPAFYSYK